MENILKPDICSTEYVDNYLYSDEISNQSYTFIDSNTFQKIQEEYKFFNVCEQDVIEFIDSWNDLDMDQFMSDKGKYRTMKHATFVVNNSDRIVVKNNNIPHYQTVGYNPLNVDINWFFTEIDKKTIENPIFRNLLQLVHFTFSEIKSENWFIEAHQFRIKAKPNDIGKPTLEVIHRDGVDFVLIALTNRQKIQESIIKIYNLNKNLKTELMLESFLDIALVDDHQVYHSVTEIQVDDVERDQMGLRDILVITVEKA